MDRSSLGTLAAAGVLLWMTAASTAQPRPALPETIVLWPEGVPGAIRDGGPEVVENERVSNVHVPTLTAYHYLGRFKDSYDPIQ